LADSLVGFGDTMCYVGASDLRGRGELWIRPPSHSMHLVAVLMSNFVTRLLWRLFG